MLEPVMMQFERISMYLMWMQEAPAALADVSNHGVSHSRAPEPVMMPKSPAQSSSPKVHSDNRPQPLVQKACQA